MTRYRESVARALDSLAVSRFREVTMKAIFAGIFTTFLSVFSISSQQPQRTWFLFFQVH
jgi:hypothetical protein